MESFANFFESNGKKLIIVDVPPEYKNAIWWMKNFKDFAAFVDQYNEILCLYNGPELGFGSKSNIARFYVQNGMKRSTVLRMKWFEKNYAFFRDLMDQCWMREDIIRIIRYMIKKGISDIRQLSERDVKIIGISDLSYHELENYGFYIPDLALIIRKWAGSDICGGGENECLEEVRLLGDALRLNFNTIRQFVY